MESENKDLVLPVNGSEKTRKRKLLTDSERVRARCRVCKEAGNLENMIYQKIAFKDQTGVELYGCFEGVYFCSESCRVLFKI